MKEITTDGKVEEALRLHGPLTATELMTLCDASQPTISRAIQKLTDAGIARSYSMPQKLYALRTKPDNVKGLVARILCQVSQLYNAYDPTRRKYGKVAADSRIAEKLSEQMLKWNVLLNELEHNAWELSDNVQEEEAR